MIQIDSDEGAVRIEMPHGEAATFEGLPRALAVERDGQRGLFLEPEEADVLAKMIDYILEKVRIRPESQEALRAVQAKLAESFGNATG